jgi:two-component system sensor histidine kinase BaeS
LRWRWIIIRIGTALLFALVTGLLLGRRFLRPLRELSDGARALRDGNYQHRIALAGDDEFAEVAAVMNDMAQQVSGHIARVEADAQRRQQLLADVAHELRNPVMTLRTMSGALEEGLADDPSRQQRAVGSLVRASDRLLHLVTDLMVLAKLDLRELPLHRQLVDLRELAESIITAHQPVAHQAGIVLHDIEPGAPVMANVDPDRLGQVLDNLLNNAISYAGKGAKIFIRLHAGKPLRITVQDTGVGIPAEHLPFIFDPFYRVDSARSPRDQHSGLGLRIARGLVEAHGGTLTLASAPGQGVTSTITLP